jgi:nucleoside-diphosphate-sugar epimerase
MQVEERPKTLRNRQTASNSSNVNFISWLSLFSPHSSQSSFHKALEETEPKAAYGFREAVTLTEYLIDYYEWLSASEWREKCSSAQNN